MNIAATERMSPKNHRNNRIRKTLSAKRFFTVAAATALLTFPGLLHASITFSNLVGANGDPYLGSTEDGFTVTPTLGSWFQSQGYGNPAPSIFAGPIGAPVDSAIQILNGGGTFTFSSLDYSSNNGESTYEIK